jgi:hypothetical protein
MFFRVWFFIYIYIFSCTCPFPKRVSSYDTLLISIYVCLVIRAFVPTLELHSLFEQKYEIAEAVVVGLDKLGISLFAKMVWN